MSRPGVIAGAVAQFGVFGLLMAGVGLGAAGWVVGAGYAAAIFVTLSHALNRSGKRTLGPANTVTLARATLVGGVTALVADAVTQRTPVAVLVALAAVALVLDGLDGYVARRTGTTSAMGARFDMETDAFLILVLSVFVARYLGWWVLAIGALRYLFVAAGWWLPWLRGALPPRFSRKTVAAIQGIVLVVAGSGVLPAPLSRTVVGCSLVLLCWSFGRDISLLWQAATSQVPSDQPVPADQRQDVPEPARTGGGGPR